MENCLTCGPSWKTSDIEEILYDRADTLPIDMFKKFEVTASMETKTLALLNKVQCTITRSVIIPHPMNFCISCSQDVCKTCVTSNCISHNVVWIGNSSFLSATLYHRKS